MSKTVTFGLQIGRLIRGEAITEIKVAASRDGVYCEIEEVDRAFLSSWYQVTLAGDTIKVDRLVSAIRQAQR